MLRNHRRAGQGMTEYIIIVALVAIASIAVITIFGNQNREIISTATKNLQGEKVDPQAVANPEDEVRKTISHY